MAQHFIIKIESFEGRDTYIRCGSEDQDYLFAVVAVDESGNTEIVDSGYRSLDEVARAWPEAGIRSRTF